MWSLKEVELYVSTDIASFSKDAAIVTFNLHVFHVIEVMHACLGQVIGMYYFT